MKTHYWFNRNRLLSHLRFATPLLLACFTAVFVLAPTPASARHEVPFRGVFSTEVEIEFVYPFFYISVTGHGNASHLGATTAVTDNQIVNVEIGSATATYTLTGANGDTVVLEMIFQVTFLPNNAVTFEGTYTVTGGTGRFFRATGSGELAGSAIVTGPNTGIGSFSVAGTISSPGH
jgi:hypothetical protein